MVGFSAAELTVWLKMGGRVDTFVKMCPRVDRIVGTEIKEQHRPEWTVLLIV